MQAKSVVVCADGIFSITGTFARQMRRWAAFVAVVLVVLSLAVGTAQAQGQVPQINNPLSPASAVPGGPAFTLTVNGTGFSSSSVVYWNGSPRTTTFVGSTQLTAAILTSDVATPGTASVTVSNGGVASNVAFFVTGYPASGVALARTDYPAGSTPTSVATGDFNGDNRLDLAVADGFGNTLSVFLGNGDGTFQSAVTYPLRGHPVAIVAGDFNGDGKLDLALVCQWRSQVSILLGNGDGTFQTPVYYPTGLNPQAVAAGDFNGDGKLDLAVVNFNDNTVSILLGNGDGTFLPHVDYPTGINPLSVASGDFNGDGKLDLAVVNNNDNTVSILLGNGDGTFGTQVPYATGKVPNSIATADVNLDGILDLAVVNASGSISILLGNGNGAFPTYVDYATGTNSQFVAVGDFNGDGKPDLAVANYGSNNISILLGNGMGAFQAHQDYGTATSPGGVAIGDFNGDGRLDFAVTNQNANTVSVLSQLLVAAVPGALSFGTQLLGTTSAAQTATLQNTSSATVNVASVAIGGIDSADFAQTNTCGTTLAPAATCTFSVTFTSSLVGPESASLTITDDAPGSPQVVSLGGTGVTVAALPTSVSFPNQTVGSTSATQTVTLENIGPLVTNISTIAITGTNSADFAQTNTCGPTLAGGSSCAITVTFTPTASGPRTAVLAISDDADDGIANPQTVSLSGAGTDPIGTATATSIGCSLTDPPGTTCYTLTISSCPDAADMTATLEVTTPSVPPIGTIIFGTGGGGVGFYNQMWTYGGTVTSGVVQAGFTAVQVSFDGLPTGWLSGPGGPRKLACRYATAAQWVYQNIHMANTAAPFCATGNSGGAGVIGHALSHYGLDPIFAMVELTSGPELARVDNGCICNLPPKASPCGLALSECFGAAAAMFIDPAYGSPICSSAEATHDTTNQLLFLNDSVASPDALLSFPKTDVHVVLGGLDTSSAHPQGADWVLLVTSKTTINCVADAPHEIPDVLDGAQQILNDLTTYCHLQ